MEIVWDSINKVLFNKIDIGQTFIYNRNIFMKIRSIYDNENTRKNAINIESGIATTFYDDECVIPIKGKFVMD